MQISVTGHHFEVSQSIRDLMESRLEKLTKYSDHIHGANVTLTKEGYREIAEVTVHAEHRHVVGKAETTSMHASVEEAFGKIEASMRRAKDKAKDQKRRSNRADMSDDEDGEQEEQV
ncbi:MAG: ribosome-associated translation inhibitor RaiA [Candidatus Omnitrophica bacterium]|nr:ribosome-associated translation inhibitor RaiA [Candidatus Omnitrophota bacterium]